MRTASRNIGCLLSSVPAIKARSVQLDRHIAMQRILASALPKSLSSLAQVVFEAGEVVYIQTDNSAVAARLRHLAPRLLTALRKQFPTLTRVHVEPSTMRRSMRLPAPSRRMSATAHHAWNALAGTLPAGPVQAAVKRLLAAQAVLAGPDDALDGEEDQTGAGNE